MALIRHPSRSSSLFALTFFCLCVPHTLPALAQDSGIIDAQTGEWLVASEDGSPGCVMTLKKAETIGGFAVAGAQACAGSVSGLADTFAWNFDDEGGVILIDPQRKVLARFIENEGDPLRTDSAQGLVLDMVPAIKGVDHLPAPSTVKGDWMMLRPGGPAICRLSFGEATDADGNHPLTVASSCDAAITHFGFSLWSASGLGITLMNTDGNALGFVATPKGFDKDPDEGGKPLSLVRP